MNRICGTGCERVYLSSCGAYAAHCHVHAYPGTPASAAEAWEVVSKELDSTWGTEWPRTIALIDRYRERYRDYDPAKRKLHDALVSYAGRLLDGGQKPEAVRQLVRARDLLPEAGVAQATLTALTPTPTPVPTLPVGSSISLGVPLTKIGNNEWRLTLTTIRVLSQTRLRFNFDLLCTGTAFGGCDGNPSQSPASAWLEDARRKRYPMIEGSGSPFERSQIAKTNQLIDAFLLFPVPDDPISLITLHVAPWDPIKIRLIQP